MLRTEVENVKSTGCGNYSPAGEEETLQLMTTEGAAVDRARGQEDG